MRVLPQQYGFKGILIFAIIFILAMKFGNYIIGADLILEVVSIVGLVIYLDRWVNIVRVEEVAYSNDNGYSKNYCVNFTDKQEKLNE